MFNPTLQTLFRADFAAAHEFRKKPGPPKAALDAAWILGRLDGRRRSPQIIDRIPVGAPPNFRPYFPSSAQGCHRDFLCSPPSVAPRTKLELILEDLPAGSWTAERF